MAEEICRSCNGSQAVSAWNGEWEDCPDCSGFGYTTPNKATAYQHQRKREAAMILAGLRLLQDQPLDQLSPELIDVLTDGGTLPIPTHADINQLAEEYNLS